MLTVTFALVVAAFVCTIWSANGKCPVWVPVLLLVLIEALRLVPAR
jgi:hypothetical protein